VKVDANPVVASRRRVDGWGVYLFLAVALVPVLVPAGPGQTAIIDPINAVAMTVFLVGTLVHGKALRVPFVVPILLIAVGSLIAAFNSVAPDASLLTLGQDAYLYLWFIVLVNVMRDRNELTGFRIAWVCVADVVAVLGIVVVLVQGQVSFWGLVGPKGLRAIGTFNDVNMFASYLVLSIFIVLSLDQDISRVLRWGSLALLGIGLLATKSNAGITSLVAGLVVWNLLRAWTRHRSSLRFAASVLLSVVAVMGLWWLHSGWGLGSAELREIQTQSSLGRAEHSSEERLHIWGQLLLRYTKSPLGIGPGNSRWQELPLEERERRTSTYSKEAHNDYLGYLVERGPLALLGLLILQWQVVATIATWWRQRRERGILRDLDGRLLASLAGALVAWLVFSFTHETLHARHYAVFLAMLCALCGPETWERGSARLGSRWHGMGSPVPLATDTAQSSPKS
jgi:hypothetical protein